ncbi:hypothetical protein UPYG_G00214620 [Umbra pygmaea]|uniref:Uncharacterized protein n=1 Tax=Umbra pygmaea TaxID=75934 RepID=A0ABD0X8E5_UMBPY
MQYVAVVLVLAVLLGVYYICKRRTVLQTPDGAEGPELNYADIIGLKKKGNVGEVPEEVEYGQVVVLEGSRTKPVTHRPDGQEDTVYAGIQLGQ